jgi:DNA-binding transcriptional LysR family regulator
MMIMTEANDADLRLRDFKVLSVVLRERSLTRAAEALNTTQPSVSKVLARLRIHFGDPLFVRSGQAIYESDPEVASATGHAAHQMVQHSLEAEIAEENIMLRVPSFVVAALIASRTDSVATIPANLANSLAEQLGLAPIRPPLPLPQFEIAQFWHEKYQRDPGHRWLRSACYDLFAKSR